MEMAAGSMTARREAINFPRLSFGHFARYSTPYTSYINVEV